MKAIIGAIGCIIVYVLIVVNVYNAIKKLIQTLREQKDYRVILWNVAVLSICIFGLIYYLITDISNYLF